MPTYEHRLTVLCGYLVDQLKASEMFKAVYYGDSQIIPHTPTAIVEPGIKDATLTNTGLQAQVSFQIVITLLTTGLVNEHERVLAADQLVEAVEQIVDQDNTLNGQVIHCHVKDVDHGYTIRNDDDVLRGAVLTIEGLTRKVLGNG